MTSSFLLLSACDTSINKQVEKKFEKAQHDVLSPTTKPLNFDESKSGKPQHGVALPELEGVDGGNPQQNTLIPVDQFNQPPQTKLKSDAIKWQQLDLETYDKQGAVLKVEDISPQEPQQ